MSSSSLYVFIVAYLVIYAADPGARGREVVWAKRSVPTIRAGNG
jgi:hypothetical protein